jgi:uncharacterized membrane protein
MVRLRLSLATLLVRAMCIVKTVLCDIMHSMNGYKILKWTFGLMPIITGIDKYTNILAQWHSYLAPQVAALIPFDPTIAMNISGVLEIALGMVILTKWTKVGAYVEALWLLGIAVNLAIFGAWDIAFRDLVLAFGALALARMPESK